ncbi:MAG: DNA/RNA non-specific endonuclease [Oscillospiraceae bacterium]|nr:DNA/RNA non-specific endonuclease [Oscillospiraceae bacterium]
MKRWKRALLALLLLLCCATSTTGCVAIEIQGEETASVSAVPPFSGEPYVVLADNVPGFTKEELTSKSYETYSPLDRLGRCGVAQACVGTDLMPTEERGSIGSVKPTGWQTVKYDCVDGKYLYNRCHLIGYQLSGENANKENLITGTRYMNVDGMLPFENMVADYVKETGNHVLYRVTPIYDGDNLVAGGVQMEALSVEDGGEGICFNVYVYNCQPGVSIDYATGESQLDENAISDVEASYILNRNSKKFHLPSCSGASSISEANRQEYTGSRDELLVRGYEPCGSCKP